MGQALGGSPAALLAGSNDIEKEFRLSAAGVQDGLEWVEATPRNTESAFEKVRLGFGRAGLESMELTDSFGQTTIVRFSDIVRNPSLSPGLFRFAPPKGADVISG
jgi:outer membrane lipoprotein carrier protein